MDGSDWTGRKSRRKWCQVTFCKKCGKQLVLRQSGGRGSGEEVFGVPWDGPSAAADTVSKAGEPVGDDVWRCGS